jgi:Tfp pilus assembly protein PilO
MTITQVPDQSELVRVLMHYKKFYISLGIILVCIGLFMFVIIPQFQQYSLQKNEIDEVQQRVAILNNNLSFLSRLNQQEQTAQLTTVLAALPDDKDYAGILFAVKNASAKAGVGLGDFTFQVGELSQKSVITQNAPTMQLILNVLGSPTEIQVFLTELSKSLPLANIKELKIGAESSRVVVEFYYKPVPQLQVNYGQPITPLSEQNRKNLGDLSLWRESGQSFDSLVSLESSSSAATSPFE